MKLVYDVRDRVPFGKMLVFALQQLLAILAATIAVPTIIGNGMSQAAALFGAGCGTLVYLLFTKFRSPVFLGSSFAFLGSMAVAFAGGVSMALGYLGLIIGALFAGLVYVIIAIIVKFAGVNWLNKLMPAVVIGPTVAIIGLSLAGNAVSDLTSGSVTTDILSDWTFCKAEDFAKLTTDEYVNAVLMTDGSYVIQTVTSKVLASPYIALLCGVVTLLVTVICSVYGKKMLKMIPFIIGIVAGYALAAIFTVIGNCAGIDALKLINFAKFTEMDPIPNFTFITAFSGDYGDTNIGTYIGTIAVAYVPVAFVVFAEHIADHKNISSIIEKDLLVDPGLHRTLLGDGVGSMVGAFFGGCPNTTYGESIGCVAISGNASVWTILTTAILAIVASFVAPFTTFLATIPSCVMGGVCIALYGFIAVSGLKMVQKVDLEDNRNLFVVSTILIAGIGGLTVSFGDEDNAITITSIACALILGIIVNLIVHAGDKKAEEAEAAPVEEETAETVDTVEKTEENEETKE